MEQALVSIIIPVYNTSSCLKRCIDSILKQTFKNWKLLLVDDGSTDGSSEICDLYSNQDERISVFHKTNGGVSSARNVGITHVETSYIVFADSDDYVNSAWLEHLLQFSSDVVVSGYTYHKDGKISESIPKNVCSVPDLICELFEDRSLGVSCRYCFKTGIIKDNNIKFNEAYLVLEDECFVSEYLSHAETVRVIPFADYQYVMSGDPLKYDGKWNDDVYFDISRSIICVFERHEMNKGVNNHRKNDVISYYLIAMFNSFLRAYKSDNYVKALSYYQQLCLYFRYWKLYPKLLLFNPLTSHLISRILKTRLKHQ